MRHLLVRAEGDGRIGLGHILRTMAVADELARTGVRVTYLCRRVTSWATELIERRGHRLLHLNLPEASGEPEDAEATVAVVQAEGVDMVLLDHYDLATEWTRFLKSTTGCRIAVLDDLAIHAREVDLLIDPSPGREASAYAGLLPDRAICLAGPTYAMLRPEFALARGTRQTRRNGLCKVLISMGGTDPTGVTQTCLRALEGRCDIGVTVILGSAAPALEEVKAMVSQMMSPVHLIVDCTQMASELAAADLVIGAGGTSALERCAMGLPSVVAVLADNQKHNAAQLAAAGAATVLAECSEDAIRSAVLPLLEDAKFRQEMGHAAANLCDGMGAPRVAQALLALSSAVTLRAATPADMAIIHDMQAEPGARRFARTPQVPSIEEHADWYARRLTRSATDPFYIVTLNDDPSGFARLDRLPDSEMFEVSILITQSAQGKGVARQALAYLRLAHPRRHIVAQVHPENAASQALFEGAGYQRTASDRFVSAGWDEIAERQRREN